MNSASQQLSNDVQQVGGGHETAGVPQRRDGSRSWPPNAPFLVGGRFIPDLASVLSEGVGGSFCGNSTGPHWLLGGGWVPALLLSSTGPRQWFWIPAAVVLDLR